MANLITVARFPLLLLIVILLNAPDPTARYVSAALVVVLILLDSVDGMVARARQETSLLGSVLDIMADRTVELVLWICYAHLRLIPVAIPIIVAIRGTIVDSLRSLAVSEGTTPFKSTRSRVGAFIVGSPFMRSGYGIAKLVSFAGLAITNALAAQVALGTAALSTMATYQVILNVVSWIAVGYCVVRGAPVIVEAIPALLAPGSSPASRNPVP
jgi:CDP-diacylglycerol--glycerol-3-phosphate 3-phosphatidyltransferase